MATLAEELTALKTEEDKITGNKVANFSYDDYAYEHNDANGVDTYNVDAHQNIPNGTASILKVNATILTKGWRAQASAITRMLMNHFLGRCSYNLNKVNDHFSTLLAKLIAYLGVANGIATLDSSGYVPTGQLSPTGVVKTVNGASPVNGNITKAQIGVNNVVNTGDSDTPVEGGTTKFTTGGAYADKTNVPTQDSTKNFTAGGAFALNEAIYARITSTYKTDANDCKIPPYGGSPDWRWYELDADASNLPVATYTHILSTRIAKGNVLSASHFQLAFCVNGELHTRTGSEYNGIVSWDSWHKVNVT